MYPVASDSLGKLHRVDVAISILARFNLADAPYPQSLSSGYRSLSFLLIVLFFYTKRRPTYGYLHSFLFKGDTMAISRGKMTKAPAPEVVKHLIAPGIAYDLKHSYQNILDVNRAHVLMLQKCSIIDKDCARAILTVTQELSEQQDRPQFTITADVEDLFFNFERYLIEKTSLQIGGQQHTARSRNDLSATVQRMNARNRYLTLCENFQLLVKDLLDLAQKHTRSVMSGYTHLQPSEPITLAHYLCAISEQLTRDYRLLEHVWSTLNLCPLGAGSMGSTSWAIDRAYSAKLLGFNEPIGNSLDAVATRDWGVQLMAAISIASMTLSRWAADFYEWATPEYGYLEVDDSVAVCSSIMPQKKNPMTLEHTKAKAAHLEGFYIGALNCMKNVPFMHCRDLGVESVHYVDQALDEFSAQIDLVRATLRNLTVNTDRMLEAARHNFCCVTELANTLVRVDKMSFREAHEIVAYLVRELNRTHRSSDSICLSEVQNACRSLFNHTTHVTQHDIDLALDPKKNVEAKTVLGGTAEREVLRQITLLRQQWLEHQQTQERRQKQIDEAKNDLRHAQKKCLKA